MMGRIPREYEAAEAAAASTTAASTGRGNVRWQITVGLLFAILLGLWGWAKNYEGPEWTPEQMNELVAAVCEEPEEEPEPLDLSTEYRISCQANTIIAGSYGACKNHASCQLSNAEMMSMYIAGKTAVIDCKKYEMLELYNGINEELEMLKQLEEAPLDDAFEEKTDTTDSMRITS